MAPSPSSAAAEPVRTFITGPLWLKLKEDISLLRVAGPADLFAAGAFHVRRLMLTRSGWISHALCPPGRFVPELVIAYRDEFRALLRFEFCLLPGRKDHFPSGQLNELLTSLRRRLSEMDSRNRGAGYLLSVFDTGESSWFYPDEAAWENQSCFWLPVNCREFSNYSDWRARFDRLARSPLLKL